MKIILIAVDTLRADRLGCYGCPKKNISPSIDALARDGVLFEQAVAENNVTQSSFVTMMTGQHPYQHGIVNMKPVSIPARLQPLSHVLEQRGYRTAAVDANHRITGRENPWFKRGYQTYTDPAAGRDTHLTTETSEVNDYAEQWLNEYADSDDFFLFLHYWDPHYPYQPRPPFDRRHRRADPKRGDQPGLDAVLREPLRSFIQRWNDGVSNPAYFRDRYDGTVNQVDHAVGQLVERLKQMGIYEETLIMMVSDHGESLGEHDIYFDHHGLYEPTVHVPMILSCPERLPGGRRVKALVQHADLYPTILQLAGVAPQKEPGVVDGRSLLPLIREQDHDGRPFVISCEANWQLKRSIRTDRWKLIQSLEEDAYGRPLVELYDLDRDPEETNNLAQDRPQQKKTLQAQMKRWVRQTLKRYQRQDPLRDGVHVKLHEMTAAEEMKVKDRLRRLGY